MAAYYPRRVAKFSDLQKAYPGFETYDDFEEDRIESVAITKSRGKGAPKKKRTAAGEWKWTKRKRHLLMVCGRIKEVWQEEEVNDTPSLTFFAWRYIRYQGRRRKQELVRIQIHVWDVKAKKKKHWDHDERGVSWSSIRRSIPYIWRQKGSPCTIFFHNHRTLRF